MCGGVVVVVVLVVVLVVQMMKNAPCLARVAPKMHLIGWQNTWEQAPGFPATWQSTSKWTECEKGA